MRRLFYFSLSEAKEPPNLITLQSRYVKNQLIKTCFSRFTRERVLLVYNLIF